MSNSAVIQDKPVAALVNAPSIYSQAFEKTLSNYGIRVNQATADQLKQLTKVSDVSCIAWFLEEGSQKLIQSLLEESNAENIKWLLIYNLDRVFKTKTETQVYQSSLKEEWNNLIVTATGKGIDLRIIGITGSTAQTAALGWAIEAELKQLSRTTTSPILVADPDSLAKSLSLVWFDRGHRQRAVISSIKAIAGTQESLKKRFHLLSKPSNTTEVGEWGTGDDFTELERIELPEIQDIDLINLNQVGSASPEPVIKKSPLSSEKSSRLFVPEVVVEDAKPTQPSSEVLAPRHEHTHRNSARLFQAVVVDDSSHIPATRPSSYSSEPVPNISQILPVATKPISQSKPKVVTPRAVENYIPPSVGKRLVSPPREVVSTPRISQPRFTFNLKLPLVAVGVSLVLLGIVGGITSWTLLRPLNQISPTSPLEQLVSVQTTSRHITESVLVGPLGSMLAKTSLLNPIVGYFRLKEAESIRYQADQYYGEALRRMFAADPQDPFGLLQQAKITYDQLHVFQTVHALEVMSKDALHTRRKVTTLLPRLIPAHKKTNVLLLLQNNLELRPTGGFIGAVAILTFDQGKLLNTHIRDIYDLDSNLKGIVAPPPEVTTYLGESNWFFRDSNWSPNFQESAVQANWFLDKEWGSRADVVIGLNANTFKHILAASGPITLPDGQVIGADNILVTAFNHQDSPVVKPEESKQELLSMLIKPVIDRLIQPSPEVVVKVLAGLESAGQAGEVQIATQDNLARDIIQELGWDGGLAFPQCATPVSDSCLQDGIRLNEANVSINKANYHLTRTRHHSLSVEPNQINHTHTITYTNASPGDQWPAGSYKSYVRIYLPAIAQMKDILVDNQSIGNSYTQTPRGNMIEISLPLEVKPQTRKTVALRYIIPRANHKVIQWSLMKQPGQSEDDVTLQIERGLVPAATVTSNMTSDPIGSTWTGKLSKNAVLTIELGP